LSVPANLCREVVAERAAAARRGAVVRAARITGPDGVHDPGASAGVVAVLPRFLPPNYVVRRCRLGTGKIDGPLPEPISSSATPRNDWLYCTGVHEVGLFWKYVGWRDDVHFAVAVDILHQNVVLPNPGSTTCKVHASGLPPDPRGFSNHTTSGCCCWKVGSKLQIISTAPSPLTSLASMSS
jgi:hypothetical protein